MHADIFSEPHHVICRALLLMAAAGWITLGAMAQISEPSENGPFGIIIHGGAGAIARDQMTPEREAEFRAALKEALEAGYSILERGGASLDAVTEAITILEDSPLFNAGRGAVLNREGKVELDASIMDGRTLDAGAVTVVKETQNPILLARAVMEKTTHVMLSGEGADAFAREEELAQVPNAYFETERRRRDWERARRREESRTTTSDRSDSTPAQRADGGFGTVGAVALDQHGNLAAGTSTGGRLNKMPGRTGDSPIIGAGTYANNRTCAVSGTGHGEYFMRSVAAHRISALMEYRERDVKEAAEEVLEQIAEMGGSGGIIAIDKDGRMALPFNTQGMYRGHWLRGAEAMVEIWQSGAGEE